ncbi:hypothetical protein [Paenibacillus sp. BJ-4]|uniref:hypothetical protein n=1 Tax=Paenibacillus sp. BJ-4 TaxID=2878097 RepID=UPI001CEFD9C0|nr:hypothetical protein [Paenibacillus sp. BJ-4]
MDLHPRIFIPITNQHILIVIPREDTDVPNFFSYYNVNGPVVISGSHHSGYYSLDFQAHPPPSPDQNVPYAGFACFDFRLLGVEQLDISTGIQWLDDDLFASDHD